MNRAAFFTTIKKPLFAGRFTQAQVAGLDAILDEAERRATPLAHLAIIAATSYHETGRKMQPVREIGSGKGRAYGRPAGPYGHVYFGRGDVQLTWLANYQTMSEWVGVDLVRDPDRALENRISKTILFEGMERGLFTGRKISDFIDTIDEPDDEDRAEFEASRRVVNGTDKKRAIAGYALIFEAALKAADYGAAAKPAGKPTDAIVSPAAPDPAPKPADAAPAPPQAETADEADIGEGDGIAAPERFGVPAVVGAGGVAALLGGQGPLTWIGLALVALAIGFIVISLLRKGPRA